MIFEEGERVKVKNHPDEVTGIVSKKNYKYGAFGLVEYEYEVTFDNTKLIPPSMVYDGDHLISLDPLKNNINTYKDPVCECGADFTSFKDIHMQYCPLNREDR